MTAKSLFDADIGALLLEGYDSSGDEDDQDDDYMPSDDDGEAVEIMPKKYFYSPLIMFRK